jgi:hypothetical protein
MDPARPWDDGDAWAAAQALTERGFLVYDADWGGLTVEPTPCAAVEYHLALIYKARFDAARARSTAMLRQAMGYAQTIRDFIPCEGRGSWNGFRVELHPRRRDVIETFSCTVNGAVGRPLDLRPLLREISDAERAVHRQGWFVRAQARGIVASTSVELPPDPDDMMGYDGGLRDAWARSGLGGTPYWTLTFETTGGVGVLYLDRSGRSALLDDGGSIVGSSARRSLREVRFVHLPGGPDEPDGPYYSVHARLPASH